MNKKDWLKTLGAVAPTIATAIGGPMAGMAVQVASKALGIDPSEEAISTAVATGDPSVFMKLKEAENNFLLELKRLDIELEKVHASDRGSARDLAKKNMLPQIILSVVYTIGYVSVLIAFISGDVEINASVKSEFNMVLGVLTAAQVQILNFWFGSSSGSKEKTAKLVADV